MTSQLLDIRERPNGDVVIKRYPFETVFNKDEWLELQEYCASHSDFQNQREKMLDNIIAWCRKGIDALQESQGELYINGDVEKIELLHYEIKFLEQLRQGDLE